jgi:hypothetical protein
MSTECALQAAQVMIPCPDAARPEAELALSAIAQISGSPLSENIIRTLAQAQPKALPDLQSAIPHRGWGLLDQRQHRPGLKDKHHSHVLTVIKKLILKPESIRFSVP